MNSVLWRTQNEADFSATVDTAADQIGVSALAVEKDYWVCEALRAIVAQEPGRVVFKGGTSLEKLRIIQRFSEDLDLLIINGGKGAKKLMKKLCQVAETGTGGYLSDELSGGNPGSFHRQAYLNIPQLDHEEVTGIADPNRILLELGESGGPNPHQRRPIESLLSRQLAQAGVPINDFDDLRTFEVQILAPVRTLLEKLLRLNNFEGSSDPIDGWPRIGRQLYDVYALLGETDVIADLRDRAKTREIIEDARLISASIGRPDREVPHGGFARTPALTTAYAHAAKIAHEHRRAMEDLYYGAEPPSIEEVLARVEAHQDDLDPYAE